MKFNKFNGSTEIKVATSVVLLDTFYKLTSVLTASASGYIVSTKVTIS